MLVDT